MDNFTLPISFYLVPSQSLSLFLNIKAHCHLTYSFMYTYKRNVSMRKHKPFWRPSLKLWDSILTNCRKILVSEGLWMRISKWLICIRNIGRGTPTLHHEFKILFYMNKMQKLPLYLIISPVHTSSIFWIFLTSYLMTCPTSSFYLH